MSGQSETRNKMNIVINQLINIVNHFINIHRNKKPFFWEFFMWKLYNFTDYERKLKLIYNRNNPYWNHRVEYMNKLVKYRNPECRSDVCDVNLNREYEVACKLNLLPEMINIIISFL